MVKAHAEHESLLARVGRAMEKEAEFDERTRQAQARAAEAEAAAARAEARARQAGEGTHAEGVAACFRAVLDAAGVWSKLMGWAPFRSWAEQAGSGVVADVEGTLAAERARVAARTAPAAGMAR